MNLATVATHFTAMLSWAKFLFLNFDSLQSKSHKSNFDFIASKKLYSNSSAGASYCPPQF